MLFVHMRRMGLRVHFTRESMSIVILKLVLPWQHSPHSMSYFGCRTLKAVYYKHCAHCLHHCREYSQSNHHRQKKNDSPTYDNSLIWHVLSLEQINPNKCRNAAGCHKTSDVDKVACKLDCLKHLEVLQKNISS